METKKIAQEIQSDIKIGDLVLLTLTNGSEREGLLLSIGLEYL